MLILVLKNLFEKLIIMGAGGELLYVDGYITEFAEALLECLEVSRTHPKYDEWKDKIVQHVESDFNVCSSIPERAYDNFDEIQDDSWMLEYITSNCVYSYWDTEGYTELGKIVNHLDNPCDCYSDRVCNCLQELFKDLDFGISTFSYNKFLQAFDNTRSLILGKCGLD